VTRARLANYLDAKVLSRQRRQQEPTLRRRRVDPTLVLVFLSLLLTHALPR